MYNNILDVIKWKKIEKFFDIKARNFWELTGYEEYHDHAVVYDYIHYINLHNEGFESNEKFVRFDRYDKRKQALNQSIEIIQKDFYQSDNTDVKFVSLSPSELEELEQNKETNNNFESYI